MRGTYRDLELSQAQRPTVWKRLLSFIAAALTLAHDLEETREDIRRLREQVQELALLVERLQGQFIALSQREQSEREKLYLRLQLEQKDQKRLTDKSEE